MKHENPKGSKKTKKKRLLRCRAVLDKTGLGRSSMYAAMAEGTFPKSIIIGQGPAGRMAAWVESEVDEWIDQQIAKSRGAAA